MSSKLKNNPKGKIIIDHELCKGCGLCIEVCPKKLLSISKKNINSKGYFTVEFKDEDGQCTACTSCAIMCPDIAIKVYKIKKEQE